MLQITIKADVYLNGVLDYYDVENLWSATLLK